MHPQSPYIYGLPLKVRDYEVDSQGIVNNANYLHYAEHTRHLFLKSCGLSFAEMHRKGTDAVVARMNLRYKVPLRCDDEFISRLALKKEGLRYVFYQDIFRAADNKLCFSGVIDIVCMVGGKLSASPEYDEAFKKWL